MFKVVSMVCCSAVKRALICRKLWPTGARSFGSSVASVSSCWALRVKERDSSGSVAKKLLQGGVSSGQQLIDAGVGSAQFLQQGYGLITDLGDVGLIQSAI